MADGFGQSFGEAFGQALPGGLQMGFKAYEAAQERELKRQQLGINIATSFANIMDKVPPNMRGAALRVWATSLNIDTKAPHIKELLGAFAKSDEEQSSFLADYARQAGLQNPEGFLKRLGSIAKSPEESVKWIVEMANLGRARKLEEARQGIYAGLEEPSPGAGPAAPIPAATPGPLQLSPDIARGAPSLAGAPLQVAPDIARAAAAPLAAGGAGGSQLEAMQARLAKYEAAYRRGAAAGMGKEALAPVRDVIDDLQKAIARVTAGQQHTGVLTSIMDPASGQETRVLVHPMTGQIISRLGQVPRELTQDAERIAAELFGGKRVSQLTPAELAAVNKRIQQQRVEVAAATAQVQPLPVGEVTPLVQIADLRQSLDTAKSLFKPEYIGKFALKGGLTYPARAAVGAVSEDEARFQTALDDAADQLLRLRSGAQINEKEYSRLRGLLPRRTDQPTVFAGKLRRFDEALTNIQTTRERLAVTPKGQLFRQGAPGRRGIPPPTGWTPAPE